MQDRTRGHRRGAYPLPDGLDPAAVAPLMARLPYRQDGGFALPITAAAGKTAMGRLGNPDETAAAILF